MTSEYYLPCSKIQEQYPVCHVYVSCCTDLSSKFILATVYTVLKYYCLGDCKLCD